MPALDGPGFYRALERLDPSLCRRVVFFTGDVLGGDTQAFLDATGRLCPSRPFNAGAIRGLAGRVLREQP
jgi:hypothetical protein